MNIKIIGGADMPAKKIDIGEVRGLLERMRMDGVLLENLKAGLKDAEEKTKQLRKERKVSLEQFLRPVDI